MTLLTPVRQDGEGAQQYLARLAVANGYGGAAGLAADLGLKARSIGSDAGALVRALGQEAPGIRHDTGIADGRHVRLFGHVLRRKQWSTQGPPSICPLCWAEDLEGSRIHQRLPRNWHRTVWDIRPLTVCLRHQVRLVSACSCGIPLSRRNWLGNRCSCGKEHSSLAAVPVKDGDCLGDRYISARLHGQRAECVPLDAFPLGDAIAALETVGQAWAASQGLDDPPLNELLSAGFRAWSDWPAGLHGILSGLRDRNMADGTWGAANAYGRFYEDARRIQPAALREIVKHAVAEHASGSGIARSAKPTLGIRPSLGQSEISLATLARELGCGAERTRRLAESAGAPLSGVKSGFPARIPSAYVRLLRERLAATIDATQLGKQIGVGKSVVGDLCREGLIRPLPRERHLLNERGRMFQADEADRFGSRLLRHAGTGDLRNAVGLSDASRRLQASISSVCRKLADGEIKRATRREAPTVVGQVLIDLEEAKAVLRPKRQQGVTVAEAAGILGVKWAVASALSKAGLLGFLSDGRHDEREVRAFQARHVKNADLAKELGILPRSLLETASRHSIVPVIAPPACRQAFYSQDDAQALRSALIDRQDRKSADRLTQVGCSRRHSRTSLAKRTFPLEGPASRGAAQVDPRHVGQQGRRNVGRTSRARKGQA